MKENSDTNTYASDERIDELLNSLIDGELTARQETEAERLIAHDARIAQRLRQLQKCKMLVASLPRAEAPAEVLEGIKASLGAGTRLGEEPIHDEQTGKRQLLVRKVLSAAAMIGLAAVLATVIFTIVAPPTVPEGPVVAVDRQPPDEVEVIGPNPGTVAASGFSGRLELKTNELVAVDAFIRRAIEENGLSGSLTSVREPNRRVYSLNCSKKSLNGLLGVLSYDWDKVDSAKLFVETEIFGESVAIDAITTEQIAEIAVQADTNKSIAVAKDFALVNNMTRSLPGREILPSIEDRISGLITIPRPVMTKGSQEPTPQVEGENTVRIRIIISR
ncbi:MAG: hypothetical protein ACYSYV_03195 [Planctomycetota bacterium]|jgi:hypothetical protein